MILNLQQSNKKLETQLKEKDVELEAISVSDKTTNVSNYQNELPELVTKEVLDEKLAEFEEQELRGKPIEKEFDLLKKQT